MQGVLRYAEHPALLIRLTLLGEGLRPSPNGRPQVSALLNREDPHRAGRGMGMRETCGRCLGGVEDPRRA